MATVTGPASETTEAGAGGDFTLVPGRRQPLADQLYGQILEQIVSGRLRAGERLPSEQRISAMFGVSRPIVRAALMRLGADGLVQARQGAGTFVLHRPSDRLTDLADAGHVSGFLRCIEVRLPLESAAARLAAQRCGPAELRQLEAAQAACRREALEQGGMGQESDLRFHAAVAAAAANEMFADLLQHIHAQLAGFMRVSLSLTRLGSRERALAVVEEHGYVLDAISTGDGDAAETAMRFHIGQARRRMIDRDRDP
ncbi:FadR/GntR family transcriptional regulator [Lichenicola sp.]|uniref:FadR/GntR family transcriptional regulator n=1 Tax=Lichenicola sp. TaxID=2804529 RepID=UPI003AFF9DBB